MGWTYELLVCWAGRIFERGLEDYTGIAEGCESVHEWIDLYFERREIMVRV